MQKTFCARLVAAYFALGVCVAVPSAAMAQSGDKKDEIPAAPQPITNPTKGLNKDPEPAFKAAIADGVARRPRKEYDPIGLEVGGISGDISDLGRGQLLESFLLFPKVDVALELNDNVFATPNNKAVDFIGTVKPELELRSDWDNHKFFIKAKGELRKHLAEGDEDFYRYGLSTGGEVRVTEFETIGVTLSFDRKTQNRGEPDAGLFGVEPTVFREYAAKGDWKYKRDKFLWNPKVSAKYIDFDDVDNGAGGVIDKDENDRWEFDAAVRLGYEAWKGTTLFVEPRLRAVVPDQEVSNNGLKRGFHTVGAKIGVTYDVTAVTYLEGGASVFLNRPDDATRDNRFQVNPFVNFVWNPHDSWTFTGGYERSTLSTNDPNATHISRDELKAGVELEVMYNLIATNNITWSRDVSIGANNTDNLFRNQAALKWLINEYSQLRGFWEFSTLLSDTANKEFDRNRLGVVLTLHY